MSKGVKHRHGQDTIPQGSITHMKPSTSKNKKHKSTRARKLKIKGDTVMTSGHIP